MSMTKVVVLNGPNLSRLDLREKSYYGDISYSDIEQICRQGAKEFNFDVEVKQSNDEAELIGWLHAAGKCCNDPNCKHNHAAKSGKHVR